MKGVSLACRRPSHFLWRAQEKVTKEKGTPVRRPPGILPSGCVSLGRAFRRGSCPGEKCAASLPHSLRAFSSEPHRRTGAPAEQRASCAHFSKEQHQELQHRRKQMLARVQTLTDGELLLTRRTAAIRVRAGRALLYRGPLGRGGWMEDQPAGWPTGSRPVFRQHRMCCRKTPESTRAPAGQDARRARPRGALFSWLLLFWARKREVARAPAGVRNARPNLVQESHA